MRIAPGQWLALVCVMALMAGPAEAQDADAADEDTQAAAREADAAAEDDEADADADADEADSVSAREAGQIEIGDVAEVFVPSEEITADSAISFPADI